MDKGPRLAIGSFVEEYSNKVEILQHNADSLTFKSTFEHPYPTTKIDWIPDPHGTHSDLIGTTGDFLRLWEIDAEGKPKLKCLLNNNKHSEFCAPLTSFDWNEQDPSLVGTSSIDTTCSVWDINTQQLKKQLIAHDKEVYDFAFAVRGINVFASVGADGSVRLFDLRQLEHSTIIYECNEMTPLLRLRWNNIDPNYLATIMMDNSQVIILDIRVPAVPVANLEHRATPAPGNVNAVSWAPHLATHLASAGDGCQALIWDISAVPKRIENASLTYNAMAPISNLQWASSFPDWLAITHDNVAQVLRV